MTTKFKIEWFDEIPSTSAVLLERAGRSDFDGHVVAAHRQTAGKGRRGRTWFTAEGNIACSVGYEFDVTDQARVAMAPLLVGICAYDAVKEFAQDSALEKLTIKWPNDLVWNQQKLMGVLSQSRVIDGKLYLSIGIGLNILWAPEDLPAVALKDLPLQGDCPSNKEFLETLLAKLTKFHSVWGDYSALKREWEARVTYLGKNIRFGLLEEEENMLEAKALGLDDKGALVVEFADGRKESLLTQDLSLRL